MPCNAYAPTNQAWKRQFSGDFQVSLCGLKPKCSKSSVIHHDRFLMNAERLLAYLFIYLSGGVKFKCIWFLNKNKIMLRYFDRQYFKPAIKMSISSATKSSSAFTVKKLHIITLDHC